MPPLDRISSALGERGATGTGRLVASSGQQLAARQPVAANPGTSGHSGVGSAAGGGGGGGGGGGVLAAVGAGFAKLIALEQAISAPIAAIPFPGFPALCVGDLAIGLPHAHNHPPNLTPPNPVPVPLPGIGPVIPIPFVSGAIQTFIEGRPAARCGDMGLAIFCGGFFPMFEVFLGSASVWTESARQSRALVDITKHCVFTTPKPSDPPMGPMVGMLPLGAAKTLVGGVPMPSLVSAAMGLMFKGLFKGIGAAVKRARSPQHAVAAFLKKSTIHGDDAFKKAVMNDLNRMARTAQGRAILNDIARSGKAVEIHAPNSSDKIAAAFEEYGPHCQALSDGGHVNLKLDPSGPYRAKLTDGSMGAVSITGAGDGASSRVVYDPATWPKSDYPGTPTDVVLAHELNHARNNATGQNMAGLTDPDPNWNKAWRNHEEANTVAAENAYRQQRGGVPQRKDYSDLP